MAINEIYLNSSILLSLSIRIFYTNVNSCCFCTLHKNITILNWKRHADNLTGFNGQSREVLKKFKITCIAFFENVLCVNGLKDRTKIWEKNKSNLCFGYSHISDFTILLMAKLHLNVFFRFHHQLLKMTILCTPYILCSQNFCNEKV